MLRFKGRRLIRFDTANMIRVCSAAYSGLGGLVLLLMIMCCVSKSFDVVVLPAFSPSLLVPVDCPAPPFAGAKLLGKITL